VRADGLVRRVDGIGTGPVSAFVDALAALGSTGRVLDYQEHALAVGSDARAAAYLECELDGRTHWGVGIDQNTVTASLKAVVSAVNRACG
jgi:2-isopropylmalate synthase